MQALHNIFEHGEKTERGFELNGIVAVSDHDGYTCTLCNDKVSFNLFFHNKYSFDYQSDDDLLKFERKIAAIAASA